MKFFRMIVLFLTAFTLVIAAGACDCGDDDDDDDEEAQPCELRGTWLNPAAFSDDAIMFETLEKASRANLNTLFVATPPIGENHGWSEPERFAKLLEAAQSMDFSIHIWIANLRRTDGQQARFTDPAERAAQAQWVLDLLEKYGTFADGVHLDYIRYEMIVDVNIDGRMDAVTATIAEIREAINTHYPGKFLTATCFFLLPDQANFKTEDIPSWFLNWFDDNPGNIFENWFGAQCVPHHMKLQQNPVEWVDHRLVDAIMPMNYSIHDEEWNDELDVWNSFFEFTGNNTGAIANGLGWLAAQDPPVRDWGYDAPGVVRKIKYGRTKNLGGFVIFQLGGTDVDDEPLILALSEDSSANDYDAPFAEPAMSCLSPD